MIHSFFGGALTCGFFVISLFFLKFWVRSRDTLFAAFAASFLLLGFERIIGVYLRSSDTQTPVLYLIRFCAFCILLLAIFHKNISGKR